MRLFFPLHDEHLARKVNIRPVSLHGIIVSIPLVFDESWMKIGNLHTHSSVGCSCFIHFTEIIVIPLFFSVAFGDEQRERGRESHSI
jgi:hypothetical protein